MSVYARGIIKLALEKDRSTYSLLTLLEPKWVEAERERTIIQTIIDLSISSRPISKETIASRISGVVGRDLCRELFSSQKGVVAYITAIEIEDKPSEAMAELAEQIKLDHTKETITRSVTEIMERLPEFTNAEQAASGAVEIMASSIDGAIMDEGAIEAPALVDRWMKQKRAVDTSWSCEWIFPTWQKRGRLRSGQIVVFGAPTGVGKSWFLNGTVEAACRNGGRVAIFTGEMSAEEQLDRLILAGGIDEVSIRPETFDFDKVKERVETVMDWDFVVYDGVITINKIRSAVVRARAIGKPFNMVLVDHIHLMDFGTGNNYRLNVNAAMTTFKSEIANRERCAVVLLAQLNRPPKDGPRKRPRMTDVRESSAIEQIADYAYLMARVNEDDEDSTASVIWCDKARGQRKRMPPIDVEIHPRLNRLVELGGLAPTVTTGRMSLI